MKKTAAIYLRVSTNPQEEGVCLAVQKEACVALAESLGGEVTSEFTFQEVWSGADFHRPELDRLRAVSAAGRVGLVIAYNPTRLGRDPLHISLTYAALRATGAEIHFVHGNMEDTPEGRLVLYVQGYAGQQERASFAERSMAHGCQAGGGQVRSASGRQWRWSVRL